MATSSVIGTVLSGRYRLESKLGSGGMSTVYLAEDKTLQRAVAVKVLHAEISDQPDQIERFRREARAVAQLSHPNVVAVIDAGQDHGHPYIVFEYIEGETLKQRIDRLGRLPLDESAAYAIEVGRGLATAHARNLVHRDVKPQNVLIDPEGRAKVTDFGIARSLEAKGLTATGRVLGTTDYVAPEQAMGQSIDARSDVYSLGVLLYEMLTGEVPFHAETQVGVAMKHVNEPLPDVQSRRPEVSAALAAVVEAGTAKDPDDRYRGMAAMLRDLESALEVEVSRAGKATGEVTTVLDSVRRGGGSSPAAGCRVAGILLVLAAAAAAVAIVVATTLGALRTSRRPRGPRRPHSSPGRATSTRWAMMSTPRRSTSRSTETRGRRGPPRPIRPRISARRASASTWTPGSRSPPPTSRCAPTRAGGTCRSTAPRRTHRRTTSRGGAIRSERRP